MPIAQMNREHENKIAESLVPKEKREDGAGFQINKTEGLVNASEILGQLSSRVEHDHTITPENISDLKQAFQKLEVTIAGEKISLDVLLRPENIECLEKWKRIKDTFGDELPFHEIALIPDFEKTFDSWVQHLNRSFSSDYFTYILPSLAEEVRKHYTSIPSVQINFERLKSITPVVAEILSGASNIALKLNGLTDLSEEAAKHLSQFPGALYFNGLKTISDEAIEALEDHKSGLFLSGVISLSEVAFEALAKYQGDVIALHSLSTLSSYEAELLLRKPRQLFLTGLQSNLLFDTTKHMLASFKGTLFLNDELSSEIDRSRGIMKRINRK